MQIGAMIAARAAGNVDEVFAWVFLAMRATINMQTGAIEMRQARGQAQALRCGSGDETREFGHAIVIEGIERAASGVVVEMTGWNRGSNAAWNRFIVETMRDESALLIDNTQPIEHHGFDRLAGGDNTHDGILVGRFINGFSDAELFKHSSHQAQMINDGSPVCLCHEVSFQEKSMQASKNYSKC